ncbi:hypothetical protein H8356DRAFT_928148 [Neocallimastix lanati (nom. inval.)]|uniref:F-box domain-containing protein n=1 Tax=Neocallimastix californiae TaxID=1754190 RepID=A0A1Y2B2T5_9FUNG|nr:hypothetical protein H8356DRAFT_928148 [Neocallimastix sp. JGI-2020a]ORY29046.1 hypothetical protein LY90DRAFT_512961 [Neocallimastix californiae]|eukprot:ORY29046.1 hypothetical protein LY90DRAFT_512961 [Neocallimastix californiae]
MITYLKKTKKPEHNLNISNNKCINNTSIKPIIIETINNTNNESLIENTTSTYDNNNISINNENNTNKIFENFNNLNSYQLSSITSKLTQLSIAECINNKLLSFLDILPKECIQYILCFLSAKDITTCACTSKKFNYFASSNYIWRKKCIEDFSFFLKHSGIRDLIFFSSYAYDIDDNFSISHRHGKIDPYYYYDPKDRKKISLINSFNYSSSASSSSSTSLSSSITSSYSSMNNIVFDKDNNVNKKKKEKIKSLTTYSLWQSIRSLKQLYIRILYPFSKYIGLWHADYPFHSGALISIELVTNIRIKNHTFIKAFILNAKNKTFGTSFFSMDPLYTVDALDYVIEKVPFFEISIKPSEDTMEGEEEESDEEEEDKEKNEEEFIRNKNLLEKNLINYVSDQKININLIKSKLMNNRSIHLKYKKDNHYEKTIDVHSNKNNVNAHVSGEDQAKNGSHRKHNTPMKREDLRILFTESYIPKSSSHQKYYNHSYYTKSYSRFLNNNIYNSFGVKSINNNKNYLNNSSSNLNNSLTPSAISQNNLIGNHNTNKSSNIKISNSNDNDFKNDNIDSIDFYHNLINKSNIKIFNYYNPNFCIKKEKVPFTINISYTSCSHPVKLILSPSSDIAFLNEIPNEHTGLWTSKKSFHVLQPSLITVIQTSEMNENNFENYKNNSNKYNIFNLSCSEGCHLNKVRSLSIVDDKTIYGNFLYNTSYSKINLLLSSQSVKKSKSISLSNIKSDIDLTYSTTLSNSYPLTHNRSSFSILTSALTSFHTTTYSSSSYFSLSSSSSISSSNATLISSDFNSSSIPCLDGIWIDDEEVSIMINTEEYSNMESEENSDEVSHTHDNYFSRSFHDLRSIDLQNENENEDNEMMLHDELTGINKSRQEIVAYKITGDVNIPKGEISWSADLSHTINSEMTTLDGRVYDITQSNEFQNSKIYKAEGIFAQIGYRDIKKRPGKLVTEIEVKEEVVYIYAKLFIEFIC